jgi:hypothetical protein
MTVSFHYRNCASIDKINGNVTQALPDVAVPHWKPTIVLSSARLLNHGWTEIWHMCKHTAEARV